MKSNVFTALRFIAALLTVAAILGKPYLPPERLVIYPGPTTSAHIYGAVNGEGREDYGWLDQDSNSWWCHHKMAAASCGINLTWGLEAVPVDIPADDYAVCQRSDSDDDGDGWGWGWENEASCKVVRETRPGTDPSPGSSATSESHNRTEKIPAGASAHTNPGRKTAAPGGRSKSPARAGGCRSIDWNL